VLDLQSPQGFHPPFTRIHIDNDRTGGSADLVAYVIARPAGKQLCDALGVRRRIVEPVGCGRVLAWISARHPFRAGAHSSVVHGVDWIELPTHLTDGPRCMQSPVFSNLYPPKAA